MNLCSQDHHEVCYEGPKCPACEVFQDKEGDIQGLRDEVEDLNGRIEELKEEQMGV